MPQHARRGRQPAGKLRRVRLRAGAQCLSDSANIPERVSFSTLMAITIHYDADLRSRRGGRADHQSGPIGIMAVPIADEPGARHVVITDVNEYDGSTLPGGWVRHGRSTWPGRTSRP